MTLTIGKPHDPTLPGVRFDQITQATVNQYFHRGHNTDNQAQPQFVSLNVFFRRKESAAAKLSLIDAQTVPRKLGPEASHVCQ